MKEKTQQALATPRLLLKQHAAATDHLAEFRTQWAHIGPVLIDAPSPLHSEEEPLDPGGSEASGSLLGEPDEDAPMSGTNTGWGGAPSCQTQFCADQAPSRLFPEPSSVDHEPAHGWTPHLPGVHSCMTENWLQWGHVDVRLGKGPIHLFPFMPRVCWPV